MNIPYFGEILSLVCAIVWAAAIMFFSKSGETTKPFALNFFKNTLASILFIITSLILGKEILRNASLNDYLILIISGVVGIAFADTIYFSSLNILGAGISTVVNTLFNPFVIGLSFIFLGEKLSILQLIGAALIISAIGITTVRVTALEITRKKLALGIFLGVLSVFAMAASVIIAKPVLDNSPIIWCTEVRLIAGTIVMAIIALFHPRRKIIFTTLKPSKEWKYLIPGTVLGAYLAMVIWLAGLKFAYASVATAINQTSVIFVFIFAAIFLKERFTLRKFVGLVLSFGGIILVTIG
ncbi:MAG TPA: DMT family transporter [Candidatus Cloacimonetes bacterium]|nr:DMT family transporter [Candidatus Cloacimonadota bacterium]HEX38033.1 DMT family transporter [Candidatus Cloacimonadota bacterium]